MPDYTSLVVIQLMHVQADNIQKLTSAANVKVEPYWPGLFAKLFANKNMDDLITNVGAGELSSNELPQDSSDTEDSNTA